jgi:unsaturated rhamnogalacturonyl hydrolase
MNSATRLTAIIISILLLHFITGCDPAAERRTPLEIARQISDKVIRDSEFSLNMTPQVSVLGMQIIDFGRNMEQIRGHVAYALSYIHSDRDTTVSMAVSSSGPATLIINDTRKYSCSANTPVLPVETSYDCFDFKQIIRTELKTGNNKILVRSVAAGDPWVVILRVVTAARTWDDRFRFILTPAGVDSVHTPWLMLGPVDDDAALHESLTREFSPILANDGKGLNWFVPKQNILLELAIDSKTTYQRESYLEWHYANGALLWSMLKVPGQEYPEFVKKVCAYTRSNLYYFGWQYDHLFALRGSYHRIFRRTMLDDAGAPTLPYAALLSPENFAKDPLVKPMAEYVRHDQPRLTDGTFCRPEPVPETVWADDLFMSVPFLLQLAILEKDLTCLDDAARQIENFYALLYDPDTKLVYHGWFNKTGKHSAVHWGRANGWMIWAVSEALLRLPEDHPAYREILDNYRNHIDGLIACQDRNGMWHQVLDRPESYEETSCTAMFILAIARGVRNGWIPQTDKAAVMRGWNALKKKIDEDGTVHGICRGTGIGGDMDFYFNRRTFDNDPRGLGAVVTAAIEISGLPEEN